MTFLLALCAMGLAVSVNAQEKPVSFGVQAGVNFSNLNYSSNHENAVDPKSKTGFHVGVVADLNVAPNFYIQPGLFLTTKGAINKFSEKDDYYDYYYSSEANISASYLQLPILASYRFQVNNAVKIAVNAGPYFSYGLGGKIKWTEKLYYEGETETATEEFDIFGKSTEDDLKGDIKRFDAGIRFGAGAYINNKFYIGLNYDLGLSNIAITDNEYGDWGSGDKLKNNCFSISVGYNF